MHLCTGSGEGHSVSPGGSHLPHDPASQSDDLGVESMCDDLDLDLEEPVAGTSGTHGFTPSYR